MFVPTFGIVAQRDGSATSYRLGAARRALEAAIQKLRVDHWAVQQSAIVKIRTRGDAQGSAAFAVFPRGSQVPSLYLQQSRRPRERLLAPAYNKQLSIRERISHRPELLESAILPLFYDEHTDSMVFQAAVGDKLSARKSRVSDKATLWQIMSWLAHFHDATHERTTLTTAPAFREAINGECSLFLRRPERHAYRLSLEAAMASLLEDRGNLDKVQFSTIHGDFNPYNIVLGQDRIFVIDFDDSQHPQLAVYDLLHFVAVSSVILQGRDRLNRKLLAIAVHSYNRHTSVPISQRFLRRMIPFYFVWVINRESARGAEASKRLIKRWEKALERSLTRGRP